MFSIAPAAVPSVTIPAQSISSFMLTINWMEPDVPNGVISHYTVFYLPVSGPYGPISNRKKRQLAQDGEFAMNYTGTSGTLTNLNGSVTYRIQLSAVALYTEYELLLGERSTAEFTTTSEGSELYICNSYTMGTGAFIYTLYPWACGLQPYVYISGKALVSMV